MAQGKTASGKVGKNVGASVVASPAFCIPTSMEIVLFFAVLKWKRYPMTKPVM